MTPDQLRADIKWWESKRWIFNVFVGILGTVAILICLSEQPYKWTFRDSLGIVYWGIGANFFYSLGTLVELFDWYYLKNKLGLKKLRLLFFIFGTLVSGIYTFCFVKDYFI